ncbi:capsule biosynthesis protein [Moraxella bovoculi]|uniref:capsule biosynthesis protein n=1 Tax=Moraxella bovoculi TaxID=386891 RepID=UPI00062490FA|nr:capsular biosynthesis protein [Moraxella bovoculi]AKG12812.1 capsular biosynthesis protein [Moraxella bovoculi]
MSATIKNLLQHKNVLLLQGKMGTFFCRFATFLMEQGKQVRKINFNAGDAFFYCHKDQMDNYRGKVAHFDVFLVEIIQKYDIDAVVCFNDCRPYHAIANKVTTKLGVSFFVFEEGYLRPDYITLEKHGINGYSRLNPALIDTLKKANNQSKYTANRFWRLCVSSIIYYIVVFLGQWRYPHYEHYRGLNIWQEMLAWIIVPIRKALRYFPDKSLQQRLINGAESFYLVSLQVHNDSQITHHSDYADVREFIAEVLASFAMNAPNGTKILFKHHPLDRGHRDYRAYIRRTARSLGIESCVFYGCDMHMPSLIRASIGMITINSTTGLQSIYHQKPTKIMGRALYDIKGLTDQQSLDAFWANPVAPNREFYLKFREYLIEQTQLNGSFYGASPWMIACLDDKSN